VDTFSESLLDHIAHPRRRGALEDANAAGWQTNPVCGDSLQLLLRIEDGAIHDVSWEGKGCQASLGTNSLLAETLLGMAVSDARTLNREALEALAGGLPTSKRHCAALAADALRQALQNYERLNHGND
jgi:NifU-like protein involved in Fe-S cluster formation